MDNYKSTIKLQENIIAKMQRVIEAHLKLSRRNDGSGSAEQNELFDKLMSEIERSENESREEAKAREAERTQEVALRELNMQLANSKRDNLRMEKENEILKLKLKKAEDKAETAEAAAKQPHQKRGELHLDADGEEVEVFDGDGRVAELEVELTSARYRIEALEEELKTAAEEYGRDIARLRTRLFDFEMAAMLAEAAESGSGIPVGNGADAAKELKQSSDTAPENDVPVELKEEWHEHDEVVLSVPLRLKKKNVGQAGVSFKFRYFGRLGDLSEGHDIEIIITKIHLKEASLPEGAINLFCDLSFGEDVWTAKTKSKPVTPDGVLWDYNTEEYGDKQSTLDEDADGKRLPFNHQMRFKGHFGAISSENFLVVGMVANEDTPNVLMGSGHCKWTNLEECAEYMDEEGNHKPAVIPDDEASPKPSPRPVPTGKLQHNMHILNSALKVIGKTMAYADLEENRVLPSLGGGVGGTSSASPQDKDATSSDRAKNSTTHSAYTKQES
jgi:hypothetical protein